MVNVTSTQHAKAGCPSPSKAQWCSGLKRCKIESTVVGSRLSESQYFLKIMSVGIRTLATSRDARDKQTLESIIETLEKLPINKLRSLPCKRLEGVD